MCSSVLCFLHLLCWRRTWRRENRFLLITPRWLMTSANDFIIRHEVRDLSWGRWQPYNLGAPKVIWELEVGVKLRSLLGGKGLSREARWTLLWALHHHKLIAHSSFSYTSLCSILKTQPFCLAPGSVRAVFLNLFSLYPLTSCIFFLKSTRLSKTSKDFSAYHDTGERKRQVSSSCEMIFPSSDF